MRPLRARKPCRAARACSLPWATLPGWAIRAASGSYSSMRPSRSPALKRSSNTRWICSGVVAAMTPPCRRPSVPAIVAPTWPRSWMVCGSAAGSPWVLGVGEVDPERGPSAGAVLDPGAAAVQAGELGDQGQADAGAGGVVGDVAALVEGLEDLLAELGRHPGSLVLDQQHDAVVLRLQPDPDGGPGRGVLGRVDEQVLDDPLQLGGVGGHIYRRGVHHHHRVLVG